ncbi:hypothetical protein JYS44_00525, partial [Phycisphaeraceae bacterium AH-315-B13]|nr:hypothetical protein [Phycisphaeraceae bacterium AH-315-B13]
KKVLRATVTRNDAGQIVLTVVAQDINTKVICTFVYTDTDGDTLPELAAAVSQASAPAQNNMNEDDLFILPFAPGDTENVQSGVTLIDTTDGTVYVMPVDPFTLAPILPFFDPVFQDPDLSDLGGFFYLDAILPGPGPDLDLWVFVQTPPVMGHGDQPALVIEIDLLSGLWTPLFQAPFAQAIFPFNSVGILQLDLGMTSIELTGFPGGDAVILDIGQGPAFPILPPVPLGPDGLSGLLPIPPMPAGLFHLETQALTLQDQGVIFQPPLGENIACTTPDMNSDGTNDRVHLTVDPPRLHVFGGVPGDPLGSTQHHYEQVLETNQARGFIAWDNINGHIFDGMQGPIQLQLVFPDPQGLPIYVQSLHDLDGDGVADDTVIIRGFGLQVPLYEFEVFLDLDTPPVSVQIEALNLVRAQPIIINLNNDFMVDMQLSDFNAGCP